MKWTLLFIIFITNSYAQTFVSTDTYSNFKFQGTIIKEATHKKGVVTIREANGKQNVVIVLEVEDFEFEDSYQQDEFNEIYMESRYFPQIRITGKLLENIDLTKVGKYSATFDGRFTMRRNPVSMQIPMSLEIANNKMTVKLEKTLDLKEFYIPYAENGSAIGRTAQFIFQGNLIRTY